jgi:hypothetical protein
LSLIGLPLCELNESVDCMFTDNHVKRISVTRPEIAITTSTKGLMSLRDKLRALALIITSCKLAGAQKQHLKQSFLIKQIPTISQPLGNTGKIIP